MMNIGDWFMRNMGQQHFTDPQPEPLGRPMMGFHPGFNMGQLLGQFPGQGMPFANSQFQPNQNPNAAFNRAAMPGASAFGAQQGQGSGYGGGVANQNMADRQRFPQSY